LHTIGLGEVTYDSRRQLVAPSGCSVGVSRLAGLGLLEQLVPMEWFQTLLAEPAAQLSDKGLARITGFV
jgi:hypothetical protein